MRRYLVYIVLCSCGFLNSHFLLSQPLFFAGLSGNPINTSGWTLTGAAYSNGDNIMLCPSVNTTSGAIYYNQPVNLNACSQWEAEYQYRIFDGNGADGIAMWFLENPPTGFSNGGGIGMPNNAKGVAVLLDQFNNGCSTNSIQIVCLDGTFPYTNDCGQGIVARINNIPEVRQSIYNTCKVTYNQGNIEVFINGILRVSGFCTANLTGYFGFSSSTGSFYDNHTIKNINIAIDQPTAFAGNDTIICSGADIQLGELPKPNYSYEWLPPSGLNNSNISNPVFSIINTTGISQTYSFTVKTNIGGSQCFATDTVNIVVNSIKADTIIESICSGSSINFLGNLYNSPGFFNTTILSQDGCDSVVTLQLLVNSEVYDTSFVSVCFGESYTYNGSSYNTGGNYSSNYLSVNGCDSIHTISLNIFPILQDTTSVNICEGESYTLPSGVIATEAGTYVSMLQSINNCDSLIYTVVNILPVFRNYIIDTICEKQNYILPDGIIVSLPGIYTTRLNAINGCDSIITNEIVINNYNSDLVTIIEPNNISLELGDSVFLNVSSNYNNLEYKWFPYNNLSCTNCQSPVLYCDSSIALSVVVSNINGCIDTSFVNIEITSNNNLYIPNAFSPNNDNVNDSFGVYARGVKTFNMMIFNRWGEKVFETKNINDQWDGTYLGKEALPGVYVYYVNIVFLNNLFKNSKGSVTLIK